MSDAAAIPHDHSTTPEVRMLGVGQIRPSPTNPRKLFKGIDELAEDLKLRGVLLPLIVRNTALFDESLPLGQREIYELVAGERRHRAAERAGLERVPCIIRNLGDAEAREVQITENLQREDLSAIEQADAYAALMKDFGYSVDDLAQKFGRSKRTIYAALQLCTLGNVARQALGAGNLTPSLALLIARIPGPMLQARAVEQLAGDDERDPMSYREAVDHLQRDFMLPLAGAPFALDDAMLVPKAGPCTTCPKRTGNQGELFADVKSADVCTDPACYRSKCDAVVEIKLRAAEKEGTAEVLRGKKAAALFEKFGDGEAHLKGSRETGFVKADEGVQVVEKGDSFRYLDVTKLVAKGNLQKTLVQHPGTGKLLELVRVEDLPAEEKPAKKPAKPAPDKADPADVLRLAQIDASIAAVVARIEKEKKLPRAALLAAARSTLSSLKSTDEVAYFSLARRRDQPVLIADVDRLSDAELLGLIFEATCCDAQHVDGELPAPLDPLNVVAKAFKIDLIKVQYDVEKKLAAPAAPVKKLEPKKPAAKKAAPAKKKGGAK